MGFSWMIIFFQIDSANKWIWKKGVKGAGVETL